MVKNGQIRSIRNSRKNIYALGKSVISFLNLVQINKNNLVTLKMLKLKRITYFNTLTTYIDTYYILLALIFYKFSSFDGLESIYIKSNIIKENYTEYLLLMTILFVYYIFLRLQKGTRKIKTTCEPSVT